MADIKFEDNSINVFKALDNATMAFLTEAAMELNSQVKNNTRYDTYQTRNAWSSKVDVAKAEAVVGNPMENAIWEEFGTGEYALDQSKGRKGGWVYTNRHGERVFTYGKTPTRALHNARQKVEPLVASLARKIFGGLDK